MGGAATAYAQFGFGAELNTPLRPAPKFFRRGGGGGDTRGRGSDSERRTCALGINVLLHAMTH
jgi:hypothetical protein